MREPLDDLRLRLGNLVLMTNCPIGAIHLVLNRKKVQVLNPERVMGPKACTV